MENLVQCGRCKKMHEFKTHMMCEKCRGITNTEGDVKCLKCDNLAKNDTQYCLLHKKYHIKDELEKEGKTICSNFNKRSCVEEIDTNSKFKTCEKCRNKDKNQENKRKLQKKIINEKNNDGFKICTTCNKDFTKNKSEKLCDECFDKLKIVENNRKTISDCDENDIQTCIKCDKDYKIKLFEGSKKRIVKVCYYCRNNIAEEKTNIEEIKIDNTDKRKRLCDYDKNTEKFCEKCKIKQNIINFSDSNKRVTNTCFNCIPKKGVFIENNEIKLDEETIEKHKKYILDYRKNKINKIGIDEYHKKNNETMKNYRESNKEKLKEHYEEYKKRVETLYLEIIKMTKNKNIKLDLNIEQFSTLIKNKCFYCGDIEKFSLGSEKMTEINGIDRIDSNKGYAEDNVVPCCSFCNYSKNTLSVSKFLRQVFHILSFNKKIEENKLYPNAFDNSKKVYYTKYKQRATQRNIEFDMSEELFEEIRKNNCYLCGKSNSEDNLMGIDRIDSKRGYVIDNIKSCCKSCNYIKKDFNTEYMFSKFLKIYDIHKNDEFDDVYDNTDSRLKNTRYKKTKDEKKIIRDENKKINNEKLLNKYTDENIEKRVKQSTNEIKNKKMMVDISEEQAIKDSVLNSFK
jgi:hypothetical protein